MIALTMGVLYSPRMMRFRTVEDEKRYLALVTEVYIRLGTSGIPPQTISEILRNIAKIETFAYYEGVRQGVAAGVLRLIHGEPTALDLHRALYGTADTPLTEREKEHVETVSLDLKNVFNDAPAEFAPLTLKEAIQKYGPTLEPAQSQQLVVEMSKDFDRPMKLVDDDDGEDPILKQLLEGSLFNFDDLDRQDLSAPDYLDLIRDELRTMLKSGWRPNDYPEVVVALQRNMHVDAVFLDLQLGSKQGRTVLEQVGLIDLPLTPVDGSEVDIRFVEQP